MLRSTTAHNDNPKDLWISQVKSHYIIPNIFVFGG